MHVKLSKNLRTCTGDHRHRWTKKKHSEIHHQNIFIVSCTLIVHSAKFVIYGMPSEYQIISLKRKIVEQMQTSGRVKIWKKIIKKKGKKLKKSRKIRKEEDKKLSHCNIVSFLNWSFVLTNILVFGSVAWGKRKRKKWRKQRNSDNSKPEQTMERPSLAKTERSTHCRHTNHSRNSFRDVCVVVWSVCLYASTIISYYFMSTKQCKIVLDTP